MSDDQLSQLTLDAVDLVGDPSALPGSRVLRTKIAYPVFLKEYEEARKRLEEGTGVLVPYSKSLPAPARPAFS